MGINDYSDLLSSYRFSAGWLENQERISVGIGGQGEDGEILQGDVSHSTSIKGDFPLADRKVDTVENQNKIISSQRLAVLSDQGESSHYEVNWGQKVPIGPEDLPPPELLQLPDGLYEGETQIYYENDSSEISAQHRQSLRETALYLKNNPGASVTLSSSTDRRATQDYNQVLSERRTSSAYNVLLQEMQAVGISNPQAQASFTYQSTGEDLVADRDGTSNPSYRTTHINVTPSVEVQRAYDATIAENEQRKQSWAKSNAEIQAKRAEAAQQRNARHEVEQHLLIDNQSPKEFIVTPSISDYSLSRLEDGEGVKSGYGTILLSESLEKPAIIHLDKFSVGGNPAALAKNIRIAVNVDVTGAEVIYRSSQNNTIEAMIKQAGTDQIKRLGIIHLPDGVTAEDMILSARQTDGTMVDLHLNQPIWIAAVDTSKAQDSRREVLASHGINAPEFALEHSGGITFEPANRENLLPAPPTGKDSTRGRGV